MELTHGTLLGGRVVYAQPAVGFRTGIEPVLLAASIPARAGQRVLEAGTGAGAGLLCLTARVPDLSATGVERDGALAELARGNVAANGAPAKIVTGDIAGLVPGGYDHAFANPPWHPVDATRSPDALRDAAKRSRPALLATWAAALAGAVRPGGSVTLIVPAASHVAALSALADQRCGGLTLAALWPKAGRPAKIVVVQGVKGSRAPARVAAGLALHQPSGVFTQEADAILRHGAAWAVYAGCFRARVGRGRVDSHGLFDEVVQRRHRVARFHRVRHRRLIAPALLAGERNFFTDGEQRRRGIGRGAEVGQCRGIGRCRRRAAGHVGQRLAVENARAGCDRARRH